MTSRIVPVVVFAALAGCAGLESASSSGGGTASPPGSPHPGSSGTGSGGAIGGTGSGGSGPIIDGQPCQGSGCTVIPSGQLTAGEWNDLDHWDFFTNLLTGQQQTTQQTSWGALQDQWGFHPMRRQPVTVQTGGMPLANVPLELWDGQGQKIWAAVTDKAGRAELYAGLFGASQGPYTVTVAGSTLSFPDIPAGAAPVVVNLPQSARPAPALDVMFLVDTTGSMGDELAYIQAELADVITAVKGHVPAGTRVRLSVDFYRDTMDDYVVRSFPFSEDVATSVSAIRAQAAAGGDDFPEAVDRGLEAAIGQHDWSADATARLLFLVLDAPPHDDQATLGRLRAQITAAAAKGIRIIPVSASGVDKSTEFLLRFFAVATGGTYVFLTDDSGIGNDHLDPSPTIGPFQVELLKDLLVRVIAART